MPTLASAAEERVSILYTAQPEVFTQYVNELQKHVGEMHVQVSAIALSETGPIAKIPADTALIIVVGSESLQRLAQTDIHLPVLSVLTSRQAFEKTSMHWHERNIAISAIYQDPPPYRQLQLARMLLPTLTRVGYLYNADDLNQQTTLTDAIKQANMDLYAQIVPDSDSLPAAMVRALTDGQILLASANPDIYNRSTIKTLLTAAYHNGKVLIGSSPSLVKAGSLATTYSNPAQIAQQTTELIIALKTLSISLPPPTYARYFDISVNPDVARSLSIPLPSNEVLLKALNEGRSTMP